MLEHFELTDPFEPDVKVAVVFLLLPDLGLTRTFF